MWVAGYEVERMPDATAWRRTSLTHSTVCSYAVILPLWTIFLFLFSTFENNSFQLEKIYDIIIFHFFNRHKF